MGYECLPSMNNKVIPARYNFIVIPVMQVFVIVVISAIPILSQQ